ncbi:MAG: helix-turn-helix transcriptional regulator [Acidobacteriaceae bacterium]|nr:helix-turn-helix transcriptional regulator [Acidobacteriaceae bacterium]
MRKIYVAESSVPPPVLAYVTHFPRLYVLMAGSCALEVAQKGSVRVIRPERGEAVFVPENAWDKPDWLKNVQVLSLLFGSKHIGISLVEHKGGPDEPVKATKTNVHGTYDGLTQSILHSLMLSLAESSESPRSRLLTESLLHSCLSLLKSPAKAHQRKAAHTYESVCLYIQENFQNSLTRESVAKHFGLAPNHVSRLFHQQGQSKFHDYLNAVRMRRSKFMLRNYKMSLKEVAAACGYSDVAYFCRMFKKNTNGTPTEYRAVKASIISAGEPRLPGLTSGQD